ncbi:unnamed protein product (macronuclear) [Paramecium tetraurelia]|uniref:Transmembrane protein n=1 Tax=Paramecium tetraurelia TaxID=5888 RepID=A0E3F0_PARTE|nr:uncharacterized protein GSPATT00022990001 [Paramecium tetraurelia]CAK89817.1 unnamed protein product [Paramecium tetraurelia]|eukprot:XP_001457214.1 hypothetical protein (macronuclear) [Paramecium tetraurelia strain d4-2]
MQKAKNQMQYNKNSKQNISKKQNQKERLQHNNRYKWKEIQKIKLNNNQKQFKIKKILSKLRQIIGIHGIKIYNRQVKLNPIDQVISNCSYYYKINKTNIHQIKNIQILIALLINLIKQ